MASDTREIIIGREEQTFIADGEGCDQKIDRRRLYALGSAMVEELGGEYMIIAHRLQNGEKTQGFADLFELIRSMNALQDFLKDDAWHEDAFALFQEDC